MCFQLKRPMDPMKNYLSEFIGTSYLLMIVVGSGIMGQNLSNDNSIILLYPSSLSANKGNNPIVSSNLKFI